MFETKLFVCFEIKPLSLYTKKVWNLLIYVYSTLLVVLTNLLELTEFYSYSILDGIVPLCFTLISLSFLLFSIKNRLHRRSSKKKIPRFVPSSNLRFDSIADAENSVIADRIHHAGLSWGGFSLLSNDKETSKLPRCQILKNIAIVFFGTANTALVVMKAILSQNPGRYWLYVTCAIWVSFIIMFSFKYASIHP